MQLLQRAVFSVVTLLFAFSVVFGAEPKIIISPQTAPTPTPQPVPTNTLTVGKYLMMSIAGYDGPVTWQVDGKAAKAFAKDKATETLGVIEGATEPTYTPTPAGTMVLYGVAPGTVKVEAWGVIDGRASMLSAKTLTVMGLGPQPPPDPDVDPVPVPPVTAKKVYLRLVEETSERTPAMAKLATSQGYWDTVQAGGNRFQWYDRNTNEASGKRAISDAGALTAPMVIVYDLETDKKIGAEALDRATVTTATIDGIIKKYTGAK